jgi:hypothetical protein
MAVGAIFAIGCDHSQSSQTAYPGTGPSEGVMNRQNLASERVVDRLSSARCDHEQTCNNIGDGRKYATVDVCMDQMRGEAANQLNAYRCPRGIDEKALDSCLASLQSGQCGFSLDSINRDNNCRASSMCMK